MIRNMLFFMLGGFMTTSVWAADLNLPEPDKSGQTTLIEALEKRHSDREFSKKEIDDQTLSTILWVAYGVNRTDGKRTIPTALNQKDLNVYVFNKKGIWLYDATTNTLKQKSDQNKLELFQLQDYMESVSTVLVYTGHQEDYALMHAGSAYQNVELYAAANDMASIVRGYFDKDKVTEVLGLSDDERVIISQAVGWKK